jgi:hypothetical protein
MGWLKGSSRRGDPAGRPYTHRQKEEEKGMAEKKNIKVKTFATELKEFKAMRELADLDGQVNKFIKEKKVKKVVSVSDATTTDTTGASIGLIRVLVYES